MSAESALLVCNEKDLPSQSKKPNPDKNPSAIQLPEAKTILINDLDALKIVILKCSTEMNLKVQGVTTKEWRFKPGRDSHMWLWKSTPASKLPADSQRSTTEDGHNHRPIKPQTVVPPFIGPTQIPTFH
ncbi:hypothetical protein LWI29_038495 [Acer saccharum]|uniref:Uncharacterized protein n=1 Tax=Acer saccharum TaxID=4024 RepID=A0AA39VJZ5_ACESA|nr:hypothetical protein LWI29_038495 [Acer saccharum]